MIRKIFLFLFFCLSITSVFASPVPPSGFFADYYYTSSGTTNQGSKILPSFNFSGALDDTNKKIYIYIKCGHYQTGNPVGYIQMSGYNEATLCAGKSNWAQYVVDDLNYYQLYNLTLYGQGWGVDYVELYYYIYDSNKNTSTPVTSNNIYVDISNEKEIFSKDFLLDFYTIQMAVFILILGFKFFRQFSPIKTDFKFFK